MTKADQKPLGRKSYGSIPHLPGSRLGPGDHHITQGQADMLCVKAKHKDDVVYVEEKLDGSCVAVALLDGKIHALGKAGWLAQTSPYEQHQLFAAWVREHEHRFHQVLQEGERIAGEWLAQAHSTIYDLTNNDPFLVFDIMQKTSRIGRIKFWNRVLSVFDTPKTIHYGPPISAERAMASHELYHLPCDKTEGVVYRLERAGKVLFLAKWVRPDKVDGKYFPENTGKPAVWNWRPEGTQNDCTQQRTSSYSD